MFRILFFGQNWYGSNARSCAVALRRIGCDVYDVDEQTFIPEGKLFTSKVLRRLLKFRMVRELNDHVLRIAEHFKPDIFLAFKGNFLYASTLKTLASQGAALYNFYPDTSAFAHGNWLPKSLPEYDCVFYTKPFWYADVTQKISLKDACFLPHGYSPALHRKVDLDQRDHRDYGCDVSFIAFHTYYKESVLGDLLRLRPNVNLSIWGEGWQERNKTPELARCIRGFPLYGERYVRAIQAAGINLAIMSGRVLGSSRGDLTTSRTYTIPASGGFMLHERNSEVLELYEEGKEIECFESARELAEKIDFYLANPRERQRIANAGHARCVPAYSYDNRMGEVLRWHCEHHNLEIPVTALNTVGVWE